MRVFAFIVVLITGGMLIYMTSDFPHWGSPNSPASSYVSPYFIEDSIEETAVPNLVTAVLADYRGYDTMLETTVIFVAGVVCFFLLRTFKRPESDYYLYRHVPTKITIKIEKGGQVPTNNGNFEPVDPTWAPYDLITKTTCRLLIPFIQIFALYVVAHGHHSPGGGFQGGVIFGASFILFAIAFNLRQAQSRFKEKGSIFFAAIGVLLYAGTGLLCILMGSVFLDYSFLAPLLGSDTIMARSHGMLAVEIGVGIAVMAVMVWLYYNISSEGKHTEGL